MNTLFILLQRLLPQHLVSRLAGKVADSRIVWLKNLLIKSFIWHFDVDMSQAEQTDAAAYPSFNHFFTRALNPSGPCHRPNAAISCPADGTISQLGRINDNKLIQAKGRDYTTEALLGGDQQLAETFQGGSFATIYLSPRDYHRVHMPCDGVLLQTIYVPGDLFSVNQTTAENIPDLFARNERLISVFDTPHGLMAHIMVGALIVAGIETVWGGMAGSSAQGKNISRHILPEPQPSFTKGQEMGRFLLGSTVILLFTRDRIRWHEALRASTGVRMGEVLADRS